MQRPQPLAAGIAALVLGSRLLAPVQAEIEPARDAPQPSPPEESREMFRLKPGFRIELVASEPLIADPTGVAWDENGRLFVCELHGYNYEGFLDVQALNRTGKLDTEVRRIQAAEEAKQAALAETYGTVKLLEDVDGDGRMDLAQTWADRLPPCYGLIPYRGGLLVTCAPDIVFLADRDGDGIAEVRESLFTGFGLGALERGINSPRWGLDNQVHVAAGRGGRITGPHLAEAVDLPNTDLRFRPDGASIEPLLGASGTFGIAMTDFGDRFLIGGGNHAYYSVPIPWEALARNPWVPSPSSTAGASNYSRIYPISDPHPWRSRRGADPNWVRFYGSHEATPGGNFTSACSPLIYSADGFPDEYFRNHFSCEPQNNIVHRCLLERDGAGYRVRRAPGEETSEFLASSEKWFRPNSLSIAPDGSLWIVDMYREIIEDYSAIPRFLQQQYGLEKGNYHGRIWRVHHVEAPYVEPPRLAAATNAALVEWTDHGNRWWRDTARRLLIERRAVDQRDALVEHSKSATRPQGRLAALATLDGLDVLRAEHLIAALEDAHWGVRRHALRLASRLLRRGDSGELRAAVLARLGDPDPSVRLQLAVTLGDVGGDAAEGGLVELARKSGDERWMAAAIGSSAAATSGRLLARLVASAPLELERLERVASILAQAIGARREVDELRETLDTVRRLARLSAPFAKTCLEGLHAGLERAQGKGALDARGFDALRDLLDDEDEGLRELAYRIVGSLGIDIGPFLAEAFTTAEQRAGDPELPVDERIAALRLLANAPLETKRAACVRLLDPRVPADLQLGAVSALASSESPRVGPLLLESFSSFSPRVQGAVIDAVFARSDRLPALLDAIERGDVAPGSLRQFRRIQLMQQDDVEIVRRASELLEAVSDELDPQLFESYLHALDGRRDVGRGRRLYREHCLPCHRVGQEGHDVGPNIASERERADETLLTDILAPSRRITEGYAAYTATTRDGRVVSGVLASESATSITLRQAQGQSPSILRKNLIDLTASPVSLMPDNFAALLQPADVADLIAWLRSEFGEVLPVSLVLFDEEADFASRLVEGGGTAEVVEEGAWFGERALRVTPLQRYSSRIEGWRFPIVEDPEPGEFRWLRLAWRTDGGDGVLVELAADGAWPPAESPERRYYSGENSTDWKANRVSKKAPRSWTVVTVDLWRDCGEFTLTGIAPTALGGRAWFDRVELLRSVDR